MSCISIDFCNLLQGRMFGFAPAPIILVRNDIASYFAYR